jgi:hypothetical protein
MLSFGHALGKLQGVLLADLDKLFIRLRGELSHSLFDGKVVLIVVLDVFHIEVTGFLAVLAFEALHRDPLGGFVAVAGSLHFSNQLIHRRRNFLRFRRRLHTSVRLSNPGIDQALRFGVVKLGGFAGVVNAVMRRESNDARVRDRSEYRLYLNRRLVLCVLLFLCHFHSSRLANAGPPFDGPAYY